MKIKEGLVMREVAGKAVVIPVGEASKELKGMVKLNKTGQAVWEGLSQGLSEERIAEQIAERFDVDEATARRDVAAFAEKMREANLLEE